MFRLPGRRATPADRAADRAAGRPTFLLGTGAQKAGTSWVHDHLAGSPQCAPGYRKEYHVLDALDLPSEQWKRDNIAMRARRDARRAVAGESVDATSLHRAAMLYDTDFYVDHLVALLSRDPAYRLVMDMTPDYAMLSTDRLSWVRSRLAERGVRTVTVFLMRDPVERVWSHLRMEKTRRPERLSADSEVYVRERYADPIYAARNRYDRTLAALDQAFEADEVHVDFFERLFTPDAVRAIEDHVGVEPRRPQVDRLVNASPKAIDELPAATVELVAQHFAEVYVDVARRFPDVDLPTLWPSARHVL